MKSIINIAILCFVHFAVKAQLGKNTIINNDVVYVTNNKTTSIIFQQPVKYIDRGTTNILAQQVAVAENIILVKAAVKDFKETNLSVITEDGHVYSFDVRYNNIPISNTYYIVPDSSNNLVLFNNEELSQAAITTYCNAILIGNKTVCGVIDNKWGITASVSGIYIKGNVLFFQFIIDNRSTIDYDIDFIRFYISDKLKPKRTASQQQEQIPIRTAGNVRTVKAGSKNIIVAAFPKFTIPEAKYMEIQLMEKDGGRHLKLRVKNDRIVRAKRLPDLK